MPSPIGHALAGVVVVYSADLVTHHCSSPRFVALCAGLAALPDADLLIPGTHRTFTHSITAACVTFIVAAVVTGQVTRLHASRFGVESPPEAKRFGAASRHRAKDGWWTASVAALAYASHLLLDWLGADQYAPYGLQLLWPWSDRWFISNLDIFRQTARLRFLTPPIMWQNTLAVAQELAILVPIVALLWILRSSLGAAAQRS